MKNVFNQPLEDAKVRLKELKAMKAARTGRSEYKENLAAIDAEIERLEQEVGTDGDA